MMHTVAEFIFDTGVKWILIGKRKPGLYPWDKVHTACAGNCSSRCVETRYTTFA